MQMIEVLQKFEKSEENFAKSASQMCESHIKCIRVGTFALLDKLHGFGGS